MTDAKTSQLKPAKEMMADIPVGLWQKCPKCRSMLYIKELERNLRVCYSCQYHFALNTIERINLITDEGMFNEIDGDLRSGNPLNFPDYNEKLVRSVEKSKQPEGFVFGDTIIGGTDTVLGIANFTFMGGSMGSVYGEKVTRCLERGAELQKPVVMVSASGGARMQEGIISLMQMAKTAAACEKLKAAGQFYLVVMTDPTTAGVLASFASLGDIIIAEPGALIGFAGPRVIEQNLKIKLPPGTHTSEFQLNHGMIDMVTHRRDLRSTVAKLVAMMAPHAAVSAVDAAGESA